jgi:outer membrane translocation and assembly module TamA
MKDTSNLVVVAANDLQNTLDAINQNLNETNAAAQALEEAARELRLAATDPALSAAEKQAILDQAKAKEAEAAATRDYNVAKNEILKAKANGNVFAANLTQVTTVAGAQSEINGIQSSIAAIDGTMTKHLATLAGASTLDPVHTSLYTSWISALKTQANETKQILKNAVETANNAPTSATGKEKMRNLTRTINWGTAW